MRIVNPGFGTQNGAAPDGDVVGPAPVDWATDPIAIISNAKPNARELLEGLRQQMGAFRQIENIDYLCKDSAAQPAASALIDAVATDYRGAILALAD